MSVNRIYGGYDGGAKQRAIKKALWDARFSDHVRARRSKEYLTSYNVSFTVGEDLRVIYVERARSYIRGGLLESAMGFARLTTDSDLIKKVEQLERAKRSA